jgi:hypothetical protein
MKSTLLRISMPALTLLSTLAIPTGLRAQTPTYTVTDLGPANNPFSQAAGLDDFGLSTGVATAGRQPARRYLAQRSHDRHRHTRAGRTEQQWGRRQLVRPGCRRRRNILERSE